MMCSECVDDAGVFSATTAGAPVTDTWQSVPLSPKLLTMAVRRCEAFAGHGINVVGTLIM